MATPVINADTVCYGNQTHFTLTNTAGITSVHWDFGDYVTGDTSNLFNPDYQYAGVGVFTVKVIYHMGVVTDSVFQNILVLGIPNPGLPSDYTLCAGTYGLNANYPYGDSYLWSTGATTQFIQYSTAGTYWIQVTNVCGVGSDTIHATFLYAPTTQLSTEEYLCPGGDEDTLVAGPNNPFYTYAWSNGETTNFIIINQPGNYFVMISNMCGSANAFCNVYNLLPPAVDLGIDDTVLCGDSQVQFDVFIPTCPLCYYSWSNGETVPFNIINSEGNSWVSITNECGIASDTININFLPYPFYVFGNDTILCNSEALNYSLSLEDGDFLWQDGSTDSNYVIDNSGVFYVSQHNLCATLNDTIVVKKLTLGLDLGFNDTLLCRGQKLLLYASQPEGVYLWNTGNIDSSLEISSDGMYAVTVSNYCGTDSDEVKVYFENCNECIHIPSGFSPNKDGHNDYFRILHDCLLTEFEIHIYNRWGQEVYGSKDADLVWDGKFQGEDLPIEVYTFQMKYTKSNLKKETSGYLKGNITLLR